MAEMHCQRMQSHRWGDNAALYLHGFDQKKYISEMDLLRLRKALLICRLCANSAFLVNKQAPAYSSKLAELDFLLEQRIGRAQLYETFIAACHEKADDIDALACEPIALWKFQVPIEAMQF